MINHHKWIDSLPKAKKEIIETINQLDYENSVNSISKKDSYNSVKKYTLLTVIFICGLIFVSIVKNETRNLQKEIDKLEATINVIKFDLYQTTLDHEVITSPDNISRLAKEYLESDLVSYKKSQIKQIGKKEKIFTNPENVEIQKKLERKVKNNKNKIGLIFANKIKEKKIELAKLQELYYKPKEIPKELKSQLVKTVEMKKKELEKLKEIYSNPESIFTSKRAQRWVGFQVVKVFLGMPIIPGK